MYLKIILLSLCVCLIIGLPVKEKKEENDHAETGNELPEDDWELQLEYGRYLKEIVQALESDPEFRKKLETADVNDIKTGKIARELHFVDHNVRTKLDELKRRELERLRHLALQEYEKKTGVDRERLKIPIHIDHRNPTRFEIEDLRRLIVKTTQDLEEVDRKRREEFKRYEMGKKFEHKMEVAGMDGDHRQQAEVDYDKIVNQHKNHPALHHPGSKQQLEQVWEEADHMKQQDFDPKTFFHLHDLDGNGYWDEVEVKALFKKELDKMYDPNAPEDDMNERLEEMERMREHVFKETDVNKDGLISLEEFVDQTKKSEFEQDQGWQGLDEQEIFSQQEYEQYERQRQQEIHRLVDSGAISPPPGYYAMVVPPHPLAAVPPQQQPMAGFQYAAPQGYQALPQGSQALPHGYQGVPQGYQAIPQGYHVAPQVGVPQAYQGVPSGYQVPGQAYQGVPQGYFQGAAPGSLGIAGQVPPAQLQPGIANLAASGNNKQPQEKVISNASNQLPVNNTHQPAAQQQPVVNHAPLANEPVVQQPISTSQVNNPPPVLQGKQNIVPPSGNNIV